MANRQFHEKVLGLEKQRVDLFAVIAIGASGAPTLTRGLKKGIASVVRTGAGFYTLTLTDAYAAILGARVDVSEPGGSSLIGQMYNINLTAKTMTLRTFLSNTGVTADPASGSQLLAHVILANGNL